jgi:hypothetical protein
VSDSHLPCCAHAALRPCRSSQGHDTESRSGDSVWAICPLSASTTRSSRKVVIRNTLISDAGCQCKSNVCTRRGKVCPQRHVRTTSIRLLYGLAYQVRSQSQRVNFNSLYRMSQEECARLRENVPYVNVHRYNPEHLYPKLNGYGDNDQRKVWSSCGST